jgi:putative transposase
VDRKNPFVAGEYYHVYNRGVDKRDIFHEPRDWDRLRDGMYICNTGKAIKFRDLPLDIFSFERGETLVDIFAYALMPNHFHMILGEKKEGGISAFTGKLLTSYSMYFNTKYERTGPLMCRPFRSSHIGNDDYFRWVFSYVHLNPLELIEPGWKERGIRDAGRARVYLASHAHSSYSDYFVGDRKESRVLAKDALPIDVASVAEDELFGTFQEAKEFGAFVNAEKFLSFQPRHTQGSPR